MDDNGGVKQAATDTRARGKLCTWSWMCSWVTGAVSGTGAAADEATAAATPNNSTTARNMRGRRREKRGV